MKSKKYHEDRFKVLSASAVFIGWLIGVADIVIEDVERIVINPNGIAENHLGVDVRLVTQWGASYTSKAALNLEDGWDDIMREAITDHITGEEYRNYLDVVGM